MGTLGQSPQFRGATPPGVASSTLGEHFGGVAWRFETGGTVRSSAALNDGALYVGSSDGFLYCLEADTGALRWKYEAGAPIPSSPAVLDDIVMVGDRDGVLHGVSASTGQSRWRFETGDDLALPWGREGWDYIHSSPTVAGGTAYWGSGDGHVYAVDPRTGAERWRFGTSGRVRSSPATDGNLVVFGSGDGFVYALDASTGEQRWRFRTAGVDLDSADFGFDRRQITASPTILDGVVHVGSRDASLYALDATSGELIWTFAENSAWVISSATVAADRVYSARSSSGNLRAIDRSTGAEAWATSTGGFVFSSPVLAGEQLVLGSGTGDLSVYDASTGEIRWTYRTGGGIWATPAIADGRIFVGSDDRFVYAFQTASSPVRRAVFFDQTLASSAAFGSAEGHAAARDYFVARGYEELDGASLLDFLSERVEDGAPSVVVFAMDALPDVVMDADSESSLRGYLDAGGKAVWMGYLPGYLVRDANGNITGADAGIPGALLGVDFDQFHGDIYNIGPTAAGRTWGLTSPWVGQGTTTPDEVTEVLATDAIGRAAAWVKGYGGPPGTGFVLVRPTVSSTLLAEIQRVAEYGLVSTDRRR